MKKVEKEDGKWKVTNFIPSQFVAIDNEGTKLKATGMEEMIWKIDIEDIRKHFDKKDLKQKTT